MRVGKMERSVGNEKADIAPRARPLQLAGRVGCPSELTEPQGAKPILMRLRRAKRFYGNPEGCANGRIGQGNARDYAVRRPTQRPEEPVTAGTLWPRWWPGAVGRGAEVNA